MAVENVNDEQFKGELTENPRVVAKFYADWCGSCRLFAPKFRRLSDEETYAQVKFLDVNAEKNPEARKLVGVTNLPFFATFENGKLVKGDYTAKEETVREMIEELLKPAS